MSQAFRTTVKGRIRDLIASIVDLGLAFSEKFKKPLADAIFAFRNFIVNIVNAGNRMGVFKAVIDGIKSSLEPITDLIGSLAAGFKKWVAQLTPRKVAKFFSDLREDIDGFVKSLTKGEVGAVLKDSFKVLVGLGKALLATLKGIWKVWMSLPVGVRNFLRPMVLITALVLKLFGGLLNIIFLFVSLSALAGSIGIKVALFGAVFVGIKAVLLVILAIVAAIGIGIAAFKLFKFVSDAENLKNAWEGIKKAVKSVIDSIKTIGDVIGNTWGAIVEYAKSVVKLVESIGTAILEWDFSNIIPSIDAVKEKFDGVTESIKKVWEELGKVPKWFIEFLGKGGILGAGVRGILGKANTGGKGPTTEGAGGGTGLTMGGTTISEASLLARDELAAIKAMMAQTESIGGVLGRVSVLVGLSERINELEKIVMEQEANLTALNRINRKPEVDRKNKSRIGAGLDG